MGQLRCTQQKCRFTVVLNVRRLPYASPSFLGTEMEWKSTLRNNLVLMRSWQIWRESVFQKLLTYHLPPTSSLLLSTELSGLTIIVSGCTSGIGLYTAKELAMAGARVIMACRNVKAAQDLATKWIEERVIRVEVMELDLSSFSSVRRFADEWERRAEPLHVLVNNAGTLQPIDVQNFTGDGIEQHIHVNHVAPALLALLLLPSLLRAPNSRIINVNSVAHHCGVVEPQYWNSKGDERYFTYIKAYGSSKLAHIMFLKVLANKLLDQNKNSIHCVAVHPGTVCTNLYEGAKVKHFFMYDADEGARSAIYCSTSDNIEAELVKGFAYYSCNCKPGKLSPKAEDMNACLNVWQKTLDLVELNDDYICRVLSDMKVYAPV